MKLIRKITAIILCLLICINTFSISGFALNLDNQNYDVLYKGNDIVIVEYIKENEDRVIISREGTLEDEIIITSSGELIVNGCSYGSRNISTNNVVQPRSNLYRYYSDTPFAGTTANQYTLPVSSSLGNCVVFEDAIVNLTRAAIVAVLVWKLGITSADDVSTLFDFVALHLKSYAVENCPNVTRCHYNLTVTEHNTRSSVLNRLYKNTIDYYYYDTGASNIVATTTYYENWFYN